jgi:hypothetical protein
VSAAISAIAAIALAVMTWRLLRPAGVGSEPVVELDLEQDADPQPREAA